MPKRKALALLPSMLLMGCSQNITGTSAQICLDLLPVYPSRADRLTPGTAQQIAGSNAANEKWCGRRPPIKDQRVASSQKDSMP